GPGVVTDSPTLKLKVSIIPPTAPSCTERHIDSMSSASRSNALFAAALAFAVLASNEASAADVTPYAAPTRSGPQWQGAYVGANVGYQWGDVGNSRTSPSGVAGGVQAGYNWQ